VIRRSVKHTFYRAVYLAGKRVRGGSGITILSYHSIDDFGTPLSVSPALFRKQMAALANEGCVTLTMAELYDHLLMQHPFPPRAMAITFDDGFTNVLTEAARIMAEHGFTGTVYIITGMVGRVTHWTDGATQLPSLPILTWPQIEELKVRGFEVGAHSITHGFLTQYAPEVLKREMEEPREVLERRLRVSVKSVAYPQGDYNRRVVAAARLAGYKTAVTVDQGRARLKSDALTLPRLLVSGNTTPAMMRAFTAPTIGPAYRLLNFAIRRLLGRKRWPRRRPGEIDSTQSLEMHD
jgi:peptidoglycan/xylan/chitin deacetylase (PgdA/CDA1 family)